MIAPSNNLNIQIHMSSEKKFHMNNLKIERSSDSQKVTHLGPKTHFFKF